MRQIFAKRSDFILPLLLGAVLTERKKKIISIFLLSVFPR